MVFDFEAKKGLLFEVRVLMILVGMMRWGLLGLHVNDF